LCHIVHHVYIYVDIAFERIDIRRNYKLKSLILCPERVTCNDILKQGLQELHFTDEWREIKLVIIAVRNTYIIVYWYIEGNTDLHNGYVIVPGFMIDIFMCDCTCSIMKSSTRIEVSGARPHSYILKITPVVSKILMFRLSIKLMEFYIINSMGNLAITILYVYKHSVINYV
jgi:hypothetical protein